MSVPVSEFETKQTAEDSLTSDAFNWKTCPERLFEIFRAATNPEQEILNLEYQNITDDELESHVVPFLNIHPHITTLNIRVNKIRDAGALVLARNKTLTSLDVTLTCMGDEGAEALANSKSLKTLYIGTNTVKAAGVEALARNTTLTALDISNLYIGDAAALALARNTTLTSLDISTNNISDLGAEALATNTTIIKLVACGNNIRDRGAMTLARNTTLKILNVSQNNIGDRGAVYLAHNETLTTLTIDGCDIAIEGSVTNPVFNWDTWDTCPPKLFVIFQKAIDPENKLLDLMTTQITDDEVLSYIGPFLSAFPHITTLNINRNHISDKGARILANIKTLTALDISGNRIGPTGAWAFARNTTLTSLNISVNPLCDAGARAFARNRTLTSLNVRQCDISPTGIQALAGNTTLTDLDISANRVGNVGVWALSNNETLTALNIYQGGGDLGCSVLDALMNNRIALFEIRCLFLSECQTFTKSLGFDKKVLSEIFEFMATKPLTIRHPFGLIAGRSGPNITLVPSRSIPSLSTAFGLYHIMPHPYYTASFVFENINNLLSSRSYLWSNTYNKEVDASNEAQEAEEIKKQQEYDAAHVSDSEYDSEKNSNVTSFEFQQAITQSINHSRPMTFAFPLSTFPPSSFCTSIAQNVATHASELESEDSEDPDVEILRFTQQPITQPVPAPRAPKRKAEAITVISDSDEDVPSSVNDAESTEQEDTAEQRRQRVRNAWANRFPSSKR